MITDCEKMIDQGNSIYFFSEGTRSKDGTVKPSKKGAFVLSKKKEPADFTHSDYRHNQCVAKTQPELSWFS